MLRHVRNPKKACSAVGMFSLLKRQMSFIPCMTLLPETLYISSKADSLFHKLVPSTFELNDI